MQSHKLPFITRLCYFTLFFFTCGSAWTSYASQEVKCEDLLTNRQENLQAQAFYDRLKEQYKHVAENDEIEIYYKKMDVPASIPSRADGGSWGWSSVQVAINEQAVIPAANGVYQHDDIACIVNAPTEIQADPVVTITTCHDQKTYTLELNSKVPEVEHLYLPKFKSCDDLTSSRFRENAFYHKTMVLSGMVKNAHNKTRKISVRMKNRYKYGLKVQGIALLIDKKKKKTDIFFDFINLKKESMRHIIPVYTSEYQATNLDKKLFTIHKKELLLYDAKDVYGLFQSSADYTAWLGDGTNFYNVKERSIVRLLPTCYTEHDCRLPNPENQKIFVIHEQDPDGIGYNSFYEWNENQVVCPEQNYIYALGSGIFSPVLNYIKKAKEYLSENHYIDFNCMEQIKYPTIEFDDHVIIEGGHHSWDVGLYQKSDYPEYVLWKQKNGENEKICIEKEQIKNDELPDVNAGLTIKWSHRIEPISLATSKKWHAYASKVFDHSFDSHIDAIDARLLNSIKISRALVALTISNLTLDAITMPEVFDAIGNIKQLKQLTAKNNCRIDDFNENDETIAVASNAVLSAVGRCLKKLDKLEKLELQGLWLVPHQKLGTGVQSINQVSKQVAILTGCLNYNNRVAIESIIDGMRDAPHLKEISMDGLPDRGTSYHVRQEPSLLWKISTFLIAEYDGWCQDSSLTELVKASANKLKNKQNLQSITVYSPGGTCHDYFSKKFAEDLTRPQGPSIHRLQLGE